MLKKYIQRISLLFIICTLFCISLTGCEEEEPIEYSTDIGIVSGSIDFKDDADPSITLSNIKSYVGDEVDYLSRIIVSAPDKYDEMEIWVDASLVDIFTPGDYKAVYTFIFEGKEYIKDIVVTIINKPEASGDDYTDSSGTGDNSGDGNVTTDNYPTSFESESTTKKDGTSSEKPSGESSVETTTKNNSSTKDNTTTKNNATTKYDETNRPEVTTKNDKTTGDKVTTREEETTKESVTTKNNGTTKPTTSKGNHTTSDSTTTKNSGTTANNEKNTTISSKETTTRKQLITSAGKITTKFQELGFYSIELLSGKVIKIKCTTSKFIVSTHTDISYITKNGNNYKVSKLVVTYSTGDTQVLETVEEKIK